MRRLLALVGLFTVVSCKCGTVQTIKPSIGWSPAAVDFGAVKNGDAAIRNVRLEAQTNTDVQVTKIELLAGTSPGGVEAFTVKTDPLTISRGTTQNLTITFRPTVLQEYAAVLVLTTNDEEHLTVRIPLLGQGAKPILKVTPDCAASRMCMGTVVVTPPSIDFGAEPLMRQMMLDASRLPAVAITNEGLVALVVSRLEITGPDAAAFRIEGNVMTPLEYESMAGVNVPIRFKPTSAAQMSYSATLVIESDDPDAASVTVALTGRLAPNAAPRVCANLIQVTPMDGCAPRDYRPRWPEVLTVPMGGYDFRSTRDVDPRSMVIFSAESSTDAATCTTDPEDGRTGLTWLWTVVSTPPGSPTLGMSTAATFPLTPVVPGDYQVQLVVSDAQGNMTTVPIRFAVTRKEDLIVRLEWPGFADVDLDVHLVRPSSTTPGDAFSGAFSFFNEGALGKTSGDLNGYSKLKLPVWGSGLDFEWGGTGTCDDPRLNLDDIGTGNLVEDISLNNPERDARCDGGSCAYKVFVHYARDYRMAGMAACFVDGGTDCQDGESCSCNTGLKCVAPPPQDGGRPLGSGECRAAPKPSVKVFLKGSQTAAATIPLPPSEVLLGSPCSMLYVADVNWPTQQQIGTLADGGTPLATITDRTDAGIARFGRRQAGDLRQCSPDLTFTQWYSRQP